jgi:hypothetical protein
MEVFLHTSNFRIAQLLQVSRQAAVFEMFRLNVVRVQCVAVEGVFQDFELGKLTLPRSMYASLTM